MGTGKQSAEIQVGQHQVKFSGAQFAHRRGPEIQFGAKPVDCGILLRTLDRSRVVVDSQRPGGAEPQRYHP